MNFRLQRHALPEAEVKRVFALQAEAAVKSIKADPLAAHAFRKRAKKLRALLRLLPEESRPQEVDALIKAAAKSLSALRDRQVIEKLTGAGESGAKRKGGAPGKAAAKAAAQMRKAAKKFAGAYLGGIDEKALLGEYERTRAKVGAALENAGTSGTDDDFHRLRRWVKYHWYHVRLLQDHLGSGIKRRRRKLCQLGKALGNTHDLAILEGKLAPGSKQRTKAAEKKARLMGRCLKQARKLA